MLHWLSVTVYGLSPEELDIWLVDIYENDGMQLQEVSSSRWFEKVYSTIDGSVKFYWGHRTVQDATSVVFTGDACDVIDAKLDKLMSYLNLHKFKITRVDFAVDEVPLSVKELYEYWEKSEFATRSHRATYLETAKHGKYECTLNLGSRQSERYMRIYDKRGYVRMELELKDEVAHSSFLFYVSRGIDAVVSMMRDYLHVMPVKLREFMDGLSKVLLDAVRVVRIVEKSISKKLQWLYKQVARTLAIVELYDDNIVAGLLSAGRRKITPLEVMYYS